MTGEAGEIVMNKPVLFLLGCLFVFLSCLPYEQEAAHVAWRKARAVNTIEAYEQFLERHPECEFAEAARLRIAARRSAIPGDGAKARREAHQVVSDTTAFGPVGFSSQPANDEQFSENHQQIPID